MDGMTYHRKSHSPLPNRTRGRWATLATLAIGAASIAAMIGLALLLHALGWTPPVMEQLGC